MEWFADSFFPKGERPQSLLRTFEELLHTAPRTKQ
jgi:hypothetical protein